MGKRVPQIILGYDNGDAVAEGEIAEWCRIARVLHDLKTARIGLMGHVLESMYDMHTDPALITRTFGCHVVQCEPDEILRLYRQVAEAEIEAMQERILSFFQHARSRFRRDHLSPESGRPAHRGQSGGGVGALRRGERPDRAGVLLRGRTRLGDARAGDQFRRGKFAAHRGRFSRCAANST